MKLLQTHSTVASKSIYNVYTMMQKKMRAQI